MEKWRMERLMFQFFNFSIFQYFNISIFQYFNVSMFQCFIYLMCLSCKVVHSMSPYCSAIQALSSRTYLAATHGIYDGQGSAVQGVAVKIFTISYCSFIQIISKGINVFFIQKLYISDFSNTNTIHSLVANDSRCINPIWRSSEVSAISTVKHTFLAHILGESFCWITIAKQNINNIPILIRTPYFFKKIRLFFIDDWL